MSGDLDLSELQFLPQWAKEPLQSNPYQNYEGESASPRDRRGGRDDRGRGAPGRRPNDSRGRDAQRPSQNRGPRPEGGRPSGPRSADSRQGGPRRDNRDQRGDGRQGFGQNRQDRQERPPEILPSLDVLFQPEPHGAESMVKQIKGSGRAYPVFELARMILKKPERHQVVLQIPPNLPPEKTPQLFRCAADQSLWLSEVEAIEHLLKKQLDTFYQAEQVTIDAPKGNFTSVGVCGMSGKVFGPPNHHDYQPAIRRLYLERFSDMPFEAYKYRIRLVKDEAVLNQWKEQQSSKTEYVVKGTPEGTDPVRLSTLEAVRAHFVANHQSTQIEPVTTCTVDSNARQHSDPVIQKIIRRAWDSEVRFPGKTGPALIHSLSKNGLQFFKWNKGITHVAAVRPKRFDPAKAPVAEGVSNILKWVSSHPGKTRTDLLKALAPESEAAPVAATVPATVPVAAPESDAPVVPATTAEASAETPTASQPAPISAPAPAPDLVATAPDASVPNTSSILSDLHWLLHEGYLVEFANNSLDLLRQNDKPAPAKEVKEPRETAPVSAKAPSSEVSAPVIENAPEASAADTDEPTPEVSEEKTPS